MNHIEAIKSVIQRLTERQELPLREWPAEATLTPADFGLVHDGLQLKWQEKPDLLDPVAIAEQIPQLSVTHHSLVDSTNTRLMELGRQSSVHQQLHVAEFQYGGRGRRGRAWLSPYGRNLAMSLGMATQRSLSQLGGLSLVVGIALAEVVEELGVQGVQLKWPNDLLVEDKKLAGVLIELVQGSNQVEYVVGIGLNVKLTEQEVAQIGQPVADLRHYGVQPNRTQLVVRLMQRVHEYLLQFESIGFMPFVSAFNDLHKFHGQTCQISQGDSLISGTVKGIGEQGEIILQTQQGEQRFHGGEVSLRLPS